MRLDDQRFVHDQYASTDPLKTRISVWQPDPRLGTAQDTALAELRARAPRRVLEVGCGTGALAARMLSELGCELVAIDQSPDMVAAAARLGVDARLGDVQALEFESGAFDCAVAAWMLYHVSDRDRALAELARVLRPGGALVAITNGGEALAELYAMVGAEKLDSGFSSENGADQLRRHFADVTRTDLHPLAVFPDRETLSAYLASLERGGLAERLGEVTWPLVARGASTVFVALRADAP